MAYDSIDGVLFKAGGNQFLSPALISHRQAKQPSRTSSRDPEFCVVSSTDCCLDFLSCQAGLLAPFVLLDIAQYGLEHLWASVSHPRLQEMLMRLLRSHLLVVNHAPISACDYVTRSINATRLLGSAFLSLTGSCPDKCSWVCRRGGGVEVQSLPSPAPQGQVGRRGEIWVVVVINLPMEMGQLTLHVTANSACMHKRLMQCWKDQCHGQQHPAKNELGRSGFLSTCSTPGRRCGDQGMKASTLLLARFL